MKKILYLLIVTALLISCLTTTPINEVDKNDSGSPSKIESNFVKPEPKVENAKVYNVIALAMNSNDGFHMSEAERFATSFSNSKYVDANVTLLLDKLATEYRLKAVLNETTKPGITNVIYISGHGSNGEGETGVGYVNIKMGKLYFTKLIDFCRSTEETEILVVSACYSGSIRDQLSEDDNIIVISSTAEDVNASSGGDVGLTASIAKVFTAIENADYNGDNIITAEELWARAKEVQADFFETDEWKEQAQYWDNYIPYYDYGLFGDPNFVMMEL